MNGTKGRGEKHLRDGMRFDTSSLVFSGLDVHDPVTSRCSPQAVRTVPACPSPRGLVSSRGRLFLSRSDGAVGQLDGARGLVRQRGATGTGLALRADDMVSWLARGGVRWRRPTPRGVLRKARCAWRQRLWPHWSSGSTGAQEPP